MPAGRDVLRSRPDSLEALQRELAGVERLVLLGDVVELRDGSPARALHAALPVLSELARALPAGAEVVVVPGNHDHHLQRAWASRRAGELEVEPLQAETAVPVMDGLLGQLADSLAPANVRAAYPGVWLRPDVYATHGHYLDRHTTVPILERLGAGVMARLTAEPAGGPRSIEDYEMVLAPMYAWIQAVSETGGAQRSGGPGGASARGWALLSGDGRRVQMGARVRRAGLRAGFAGLVAGLNRAGIGPLRRELSGAEFRRANLAALAEVLGRLELRAPWVIFGHTHRAGPLPADDGSGWRTAAGGALVNSGCWVHEPAFLGPRPDRSPYRAGFAVRVDSAGGPPELVNLLDPV